MARRVSEDQPYAVDVPVIDQRDARSQVRRQRAAVQLRVRYAAAEAHGVVDQDFVARRTIFEHNLEARPLFRDARSQEQARCLYAKSQDPFEAGPVHPAG